MRVAILILAVLGIGLAGCQSDIGPAKDFSIVPLDDQAARVTLADFKGKPLLLDFWATWCGPCNESMPEVQAIWDKFHAKGLEIVSISSEDRDLVLKFHRSRPYTYPVYLDPAESANEAYGVDAIPHFVFVRNGRVLWTMEGVEHRGDLLERVSDSMNQG